MSNQPPSDFPPRPSWRPSFPVDHDRVVTTFQYYSGSTHPFVVYRHGTVVPVAPESTNIERDAMMVLGELFHRHPDFNPLEMDDGHWLVSYSNDAFNVCFADQVKACWEYIEQHHLEGLTSDEVLVNTQGKANVFDARGKIGLFGRAHWFLDASDPVVARVVPA